MFGSRAIYHDGWKAVTFHPVGPIYDDGLNPNAPFDDDVWELYHVAEDLSETDDLAGAEPERLAAMVACGGRRRRATTCCPWTTGRCGRSSTRSPTTGATAPCSATSRVGRRSPSPSPCRSRTAPMRCGST
jgi:hypothetical protein